MSCFGEKRTVLGSLVFGPFNSSPNGKYLKGLGIIAVGGVSLLVIGIIVRMLKQQKT